MGRKVIISDELSPTELNNLLIENHRFSLFSFSLVYANLLTGNTFLDEKFFFSGSSQNLQRLNQELESLKTKSQRVLKKYFSTKYHFEQIAEEHFKLLPELAGFYELLDSEIAFNKDLLSYLAGRRGLSMLPETRISLIFSLIMKEKIQVKQNERQDFYETFKKELPDIPQLSPKALDDKFNTHIFDMYLRFKLGQYQPNFDAVFGLMNWFHKYTSYFSQVEDDFRDQLEDRVRKLFKAKNIENKLGGIILVDLLNLIAQSYFEETSEATIASIPFQETTIPAVFPTFDIKFREDSIEIGELITHDSRVEAVYKEYKLNSESVTPKERIVQVRDKKIRCEIFFPGGEKFQAGEIIIY